MRTRKLGYTELELTTVGLGTWAIGGPWQFGWGPQDDDDSKKTILEAIDEGINWIDTAPIYGCGHSEEIVGAALKKTNSRPFIATKCGLLWNAKREKVNILKAGSIRNECLASLLRLGVEMIDLYQMHWSEPDEDIEEAWGEMAKLVEEGKVRYIGVSNFTVEQIKRVQKIHPAASLQPRYNMFQREVEDELLPYCGKNNIGVIVYSPMAKGLLTGKFDKELLSALPADDQRRKREDFQQPRFDVNVEIVKELQTIAAEKRITCAQLSIAWVLRRDEVTSAICGARKPGQIVETAKAADIELSESEVQKVEDILSQREEKIANLS